MVRHGGKMMDPEPFRGKNIAVVGNSERLLDCDFGDLIDSHDIVIRFNRAWPNRAKKPNSTGKKTTHMGLVIRHGYTKMVVRNPHITFFMPMKPRGMELIPRECAKMACIPHSTMRSAADEIGAGRRPSSGAIVLKWLLSDCDTTMVSVFGMDGMASGKWYEKKPHWIGHDPEAERRYFKKLSMLKKVKFHG